MVVLSQHTSSKTIGWWRPIARTKQKVARPHLVREGRNETAAEARGAASDWEQNGGMVEARESAADFSTSLFLELITDCGAVTAVDETKLDERVSDVLNSIYILETSGRPRDASIAAMRCIEEFFDEGDLRSVDRFLAELELKRLKQWTVIGVIRATARVADRLPSWKLVQRRAVERLKVLNVDVEKVFVGL